MAALVRTSMDSSFRTTLGAFDGARCLGERQFAVANLLSQLRIGLLDGGGLAYLPLG